MEIYCEAMRALDLPEWPKLLEMLPYEETNDYLQAYVVAYTACKVAKQDHADFDALPIPAEADKHWEKSRQLLQACTKANRLRQKAWLNLLEVLQEPTASDEE